MTHIVDKVEAASKYFCFIGKKERNRIRSWYQTVEWDDDRKGRFLEIIDIALRKVNYDFRISAIEPSLNEKRELYFKKGAPVATGISIATWKYLAKEYLPQYSSRVANIYELFLWYALRIVDGYWTFDYVAIDSSSYGNYIDSPSSIKGIELSGTREVGGFCDGIGNTFKYVIYDEGITLCGGMNNVSGKDYPVADYCYYVADMINVNATSVIVLMN